MSIPVTRTKIILPRRRQDLLSRQRLVDLLFELLDYKLIVLAAPAGYGKTSLIIDFAHQSELPVCWYSLDNLDQDPGRFIAHFIASINYKFPAFGQQARAALESSSQGRIDIDAIVSATVNEAIEHIREHFLLILDDYHLVNDNKEINYFVNRFIQDADENCHLILSSRALLTLPEMTLMVARSMVGGLSFEELAFLPEEIQSLILQNYHMTMPKGVADELAEETEGWITGLLLSAQTMWQGMADRLRVARVSRVGLYEYLAQQVLDQQPAAVHDFLLRTSLLEEFDIKLIEDVLGKKEDWRNLFDSVLKGNLFVLPVGEEGQFIRYHNLFRDFLQNRMGTENATERDRILHKLADVYAGRGDYEKAYSVYQRLADYNNIAKLIEKAGPLMIKSGRLALLAEWTAALPAAILNSQPTLLSLRAATDIVFGRIDQALELLNMAESAQRASDDRPGLARTLTRRAMAERYLSDNQAALHDATEALSLTNDIQELNYVRAEALRSMGVSLYQIGELDEAIERLAQSLSIYTQLEDQQNRATVLMELGLAHVTLGHYQQGLSNYEQALHYYHSANNALREANLLNNLGVLYYLTGNYEKAGRIFEQALEQARQNNYQRMEAYILCGIGDLYSDLEAIEPALDAYRQAREVARKIDYRFLLIYTDLATAAQLRLSESYRKAGHHLKSARNHMRETSSHHETGLYYLEAGQLDIALGDTERGVQELRQAVDAFIKGNLLAETTQAYLHLAFAYFRAQDINAALLCIEDAFQHASQLESQQCMVVAARNYTPLLELASYPPYKHPQASELLSLIQQYKASLPGLRKRLRPYTSTIPFTPPKITIHAFGRAQVEQDGKPITAPEWQNQRRVRELFFYLLAHPEGLSKEEIGLEFWPDSSSSQLKLQFKNAIYRLRHALGADIISYDEDIYWFNRQLDYEYDVESFLTHLDEANLAKESGKKIEAYQTVVNLYQGPFLPDAEGVWVWTERERLRRLYLEARLVMAELQFESGDLSSCLENCQLILKEDSCLEEAHRLAMRIFAARGNRAAINRQYESCQLALRDEINAQPSPQTVALYKTLVRN